jgi:hypothetical protein
MQVDWSEILYARRPSLVKAVVVSSKLTGSNQPKSVTMINYQSTAASLRQSASKPQVHYLTVQIQNLI